MIKPRHHLLILFILVLTTPVTGQSMASLDNAKQAYENNDFETAIQFFELTISGGIYNGEIFYNLGNAHYQQENIGNALLNYRRALQYLPRDLDLNIQIARTRALRPLPESDTTHPIILLEQVAATALTITELSFLTLILWTTLWLLLGTYQIRKPWRNILKLIIAVNFVFVLGLGLLMGSRLYIQYSMPPAIVTSGSAPIYSGPSISYFRQYDLFEANEIYITETQDEWSKFVTGDNRIGWIHTEHYTLLDVK